MKKETIYQKIQTIARQLTQKQSQYTRADIAYELSNLGVEKDSLNVSTLIWEAYSFYNNDRDIKQAFINNEKKQSIVDEYQICQLIKENDGKSIFKYVNNKLNKSSNSLKLLEEQINKSQRDVVSNRQNIGDIVQGTQAITNIKNEASSIFKNYSLLINSYEKGKDDIKAILQDFVFIRGKIIETHRECALALTDTFGESIRSISPEIFDFESVKFLDVQSMHQQIALEYNNITNSCANLMSEISENFAQSLLKASSSYKLAGNNKELGLILAGLNLFSHYSNSNQRASVLKRDLESLNTKVKKDTVSIKGDLSRLLVIYKTMNDVHIPKADAFYRKGKDVLTDELQSLLNSLYSTPELTSLKQERDKVLSEYKDKENHLIDLMRNIDFYTASVESYQDTLNKKKPLYSRPLKYRYLTEIQ